MVPKPVARSAISRQVRTFYASDLLLVAEVVSPRSGGEQTDQVRKVSEYAKAGIPVYWIVELDPDPKVTVLTLGDGEYQLDTEVRGRARPQRDRPVPGHLRPGNPHRARLAR